MMFLTETNLYEITKQQYIYKFKAYISLLFGLAAVQLIALAFSLVGVGGMSSSGGNGINVNVYHYSSNMVITYTLIWAFVSGIICTDKTHKNYDFTYVSNRISSNLSSVGFLFTAGIAGGVMATLCGVLIRVIMFFTLGSRNISLEYFFIQPHDLLTGIISGTLYILLAMALGYFIGTLAQINLGIVALLPMLFILGLRLSTVRDFFAEALINESSLLRFSIKVFATTLIMFWAAIQLSNRLEVRR